MRTISFSIEDITCSLGERSFQSAAASAWNALPRSVRSSTSVLQFRSRLKTEPGSGQNYSRVHTSNLTESVSASLLFNIFVPIFVRLNLCHVIDYYKTN